MQNSNILLILNALLCSYIKFALSVDLCKNDDDWLVWKEITARMDSNMRGYDFQFCCGVKSLRLIPFSGRWQLDTENVIKLDADDENLGQKFPLTVCDKKKLIFGQARPSDGKECKSHEGTVLPVLTSRHNLNLNRWYAVCYDGDEPSAGQCTQCSVELLCPNEHNPECKKVWIDGSVGGVTNTTMNFTVHTGELPFAGQMLVQLFEQRLNQEALVIKRVMVSAEPHFTQSITMDNLKMDTYYVWSACVKLAVSQSFSRQYNVRVPSNEQTICAPNVTAKTLTNYGSSEHTHDHGAAGHLRNFPLISVLTVIISTLLLLL